MTEVAREEGRGRGRESEEGREGKGEGEGEEEGGSSGYFGPFRHIDRRMGGCGMNKEGFLILLELCSLCCFPV